MDSNTEKLILKATNAREILGTELIQKLWNNYGDLLRVRLRGGHAESVILKHIKLPSDSSHPRGFGSDVSKRRKINSYRVETQWYEKFNPINLKDEGSPTAGKLASFQKKGEFFILLEDLDALGFGRRLTQARFQEIALVLSWLASFHAKFLQHESAGLWHSGTYWHLETRPDELKALDDLPLKQAASLIDQRLKNTRYLTLVHGDAKLANFCFSDDLSRVAAVDFQYVGRGCGMKDVAYFIGSCLSEDQCEKQESHILDLYFRELSANIHDPTIDKKQLEDQWRALYPVAWADFHRFLKGWSPGHWKINSYSEKTSRKVVDSILQELLAEAQKACVEAGRLVKSYWQTAFEISSKEGSTPSSRVVTEVDLLSQQKIVALLKPSMATYGLGFLSEEEPDNQSRFSKDFFWSVDPLDGTLPFSEGRPGFAVTIALVDKTGVPLIGVVYDPVSETLFHAVQNRGSFQDNRPLQRPKFSYGDPLHLFADQSLQQAPNYPNLEKNFTVHFTGGAVMNALSVLLHPMACYFKYPKKETGGCAIWDLAAVSLIVKEAGGVMTDFQGKALSFNRPDTLYFNQEGLMVCSHPSVLNKVRKQI